MRSETCIDISSLTQNTEWTVPKAGYIVTVIRSNSTTLLALAFNINGVFVKNSLNMTANCLKHYIIPVSKGDIFYWDASDTLTDVTMKFYYCNGTVPK